MEGRTVLGFRRAVNMLTAQVRKWRSTGPLAEINEEPGDDEREGEDPDYRLPRSGRIAVREDAR
eukprot:3682373-Lingulodinium_polyedra.AAC.1